MYIYICIFVSNHIYVYIHIYMHIYIYMYINIYIYMYICAYVHRCFGKVKVRTMALGRGVMGIWCKTHLQAYTRRRVPSACSLRLLQGTRLVLRCVFVGAAGGERKSERENVCKCACILLWLWMWLCLFLCEFMRLCECGYARVGGMEGACFCRLLVHADQRCWEKERDWMSDSVCVHLTYMHMYVSVSIAERGSEYESITRDKCSSHIRTHARTQTRTHTHTHT